MTAQRKMIVSLLLLLQIAVKVGTGVFCVDRVDCARACYREVGMEGMTNGEVVTGAMRRTMAAETLTWVATVVAMKTMVVVMMAGMMALGLRRGQLAAWPWCP